MEMKELMNGNFLRRNDPLSLPERRMAKVKENRDSFQKPETNGTWDAQFCDPRDPGILNSESEFQTKKKCGRRK